MKELADLIRFRFTPLAMLCDCQGADSDCQDAKQNPAVVAQYDTVQRIAKFVEEQP
jgi:hypothetical protein